MAQEADRLLDVALPGFQNGVAGESLAARCGFGSPPRVRGKPGLDEGRREGAGLIPTCAGKTPRIRLRPPATRAHPHMCGENMGLTLSMRRTRGSSPRVRGKRLADRLRDASLALIPARAGKTRRTPARCRRRWAHPRACGENGMELVRAILAAGSSPRVRGTVDSEGDEAGGGDLIPTCAGKTAVMRSSQ